MKPVIISPEGRILTDEAVKQEIVPPSPDLSKLAFDEATRQSTRSNSLSSVMPAILKAANPDAGNA